MTCLPWIAMASPVFPLHVGHIPALASRLSPNPFCPGVVVVFSLSFSFLLGGGGGRAGLAAAVKRRSRPPVRIKTNVPKKVIRRRQRRRRRRPARASFFTRCSQAGGRAGRGRVTGDGRTNAGCVASCEKKGSEQAGEGTNERTSERRRKRRRKLLQRRRRRRNRLLASKEKTEREAAAAAARQFCDVWRPAKFRRESVEKKPREMCDIAVSYRMCCDKYCRVDYDL